MKLRLLTAGAALLIVVPILFLGGVWGAAILCVAAECLALWEYGALRTPKSSTGGRVFTMVLAALPILAATASYDGGLIPSMALMGKTFVIARPTRADWVLLAVGVAALAVPIRYVFEPGKMETVPQRMAGTLFGVVYLGLALGFCVMLRALPNGLLWVCFGLATTWLGDTGAYVGGRALGKNKMAPEISPKKTWEGFACGLAAAIATGFVARAIFEWHGPWHGHEPLWQGIPMKAGDVLLAALISGLLAVVGDLSESLLKRAAGVKDSGTMFPGHGGMLDRIDALLFSLPGVYFYVKFLFARLF